MITLDQGKEFNNDLNKKLMAKLGIDHRLTTPYYPQVRASYNNNLYLCVHMHI